ncbi:hypothetical protein BFL43_18600 [Williamsia sp. 1135]|nr:hypothetical protein BFL43_18600 [Williamsia sp. 1135]
MTVAGMTSRHSDTGNEAWTVRCDRCEHRFRVVAVGHRADAEVVAAANGWDINDHRTLCPACASVR